MFHLLLIPCVCFLIELVTANPLTLSISSCPFTNYQQNVYRPYGEAFVIQPNNIDPYSQQIVLQTPLSYQPSQELMLKDHINHIYWNTLLSNPIVQSIIDPNNINYNQYGNGLQTISPNPYTGDVVNNFIIVPPEPFEINKTNYEPKDIRANKNLKDTKKDHETPSTRRKKVLDSNSIRNDVLFDNLNHQRGKKYIKKVSGNFDAANIKCYTSSEVLDDRNNKAEDRYQKNKKSNKADNKKNTSIKMIENKVEKSKPVKSKKNKVKKKLKDSERKNHKHEVMENASTKTTKRKKSKQLNPVFDNCKWDVMAEKPKIDYETKVRERVPEICYDNIDDIFNLKPDCVDLENRRTRNSNNELAMKDYNTIYSNLPDDITGSYLRYITDLLSNPKVANFDSKLSNNMYTGNNMYPYDFNQMYKVPTYSNKDVNKSNGSKGRNRNSKRKKKHKKNSSKKNKNEGKIASKNDSITPASRKLTIADELERATEVQPTTKINTTDFTTERLPVMMEALSTEHSQSLRDDLELFKEPVPEFRVADTFEINEKVISSESPKEELIEIQELFETHIPESVKRHKGNEANTEKLQSEVEVNDESTSTEDSYEFEQTPELGLEDETPNIYDYRLLEDYYPDFTKDNHAYLVSSEEVDVRNIHDRYFYTTDKNIDSKEFRQKMPDHTRIFKDKLSYEENKKLIKTRNDKDNLQEHLESEEIVFKTPPGLDFPDFITRQINRNRQDSTDISYQNINDDDEYDRFNFDSIAEKNDQSFKTSGKYVKAVENKPGNVVETVYARSKVVKYGQGHVSENPLKPKSNVHFVDTPESTLQNDRDTTLVIAKSLSPKDIW